MRVIGRSGGGRGEDGRPSRAGDRVRNVGRIDDSKRRVEDVGAGVGGRGGASKVVGAGADASGLR